MAEARRTWFGIARHPGRAEFHLGTVVADAEEGARRELLALWARISPHPPPEIARAVPGHIVVVEDDADG